MRTSLAKKCDEISDSQVPKAHNYRRTDLIRDLWSKSKIYKLQVRHLRAKLESQPSSVIKMGNSIANVDERIQTEGSVKE